ncbi:unnamed protein product [Peronospora belbahrii]|uniref:Uncharacterized protein n=1 Tax=Peronospora belbahrii TaxID=622444 RepID=A0AAU9L2P0_9STRA|nr:unnamed protein product [Peronospora belbahrii]CAH0515598.1 unnamed protein product [Peronospora belbahrii]
MDSHGPPPILRLTDSSAIKAFAQQRHSGVCFVREALESTVYKQKASADQSGRKHHDNFQLVTPYCFTSGIQDAAFYILDRNIYSLNAYTLDIRTAMRLQSTLYVGRLRPYWLALLPMD